jgi:hypothetical protein
MKIYLGSADLITEDNKCWTWRCVVYAFDATDAKNKVKNYIKTSPHMGYVTDIVSVVCKDVAVVV